MSAHPMDLGSMWDINHINIVLEVEKTHENTYILYYAVLCSITHYGADLCV